MFLTSEVSINNLIVHSVGNKLKGDSLFLSNSTIAISSDLEEILLKFMFLPFKSNELFNFHDTKNNKMYQSIQTLFNNTNSFLQESKKIATHLFEEANNPKVNGGNLFIAYLKGITINDVVTDAVGMFKAENSDTFIKIKPSNDKVSIEKESGINITKLTKGAIIFNMEADNGYIISIVDKRSRNEEISYWNESFLNTVPYHDNYYQTKNTMSCVEHFVTNGLPDMYDVDRSQQADLLNRSLTYFKDSKDFNWNQFAKEIFVVDDVIEGLETYKESFEQDNDVEIAPEFEISIPAVKKQAKIFKSTIKLDDKFDIIIHKDKENLIRGKDKATGLNYYQLLFEREE